VRIASILARHPVADSIKQRSAAPIGVEQTVASDTTTEATYGHMPLRPERDLRRASAEMGDGACILRGRALSQEAKLLASLEALTSLAPLRLMVTPSYTMSVSTANSWTVHDCRALR
jgi:hypothetical protein